jgi:hypothetical protein
VAYTGGLTLTIAGGILFVVGSTLLLALYTSNSDADCSASDDSTVKCLIAGGVGVLGVAGIVIGIPMLIGGAARVPASSPGKTAAPSWLPARVAVSRTGAEAGWTF